MKVALFIPCYIDQFYPQVGQATLQLLEKTGVEVVYPAGQTCCGQPMANSGFEDMTLDCSNNFVTNFDGFEYIVCPSGSCTMHVKEHLHPKSKNLEIGKRVYELTEFLCDVVKVQSLEASYPYKVGIHQSCHGQRGLKLAQMSELMEPPFSKVEDLLKMVKGIELVNLDRKDECCGFGGSFCVFEEAVSVKMGKDRVEDHERNNAEVITAGDMSCLMHLEGILRRKKSPVKVAHIAEILNAKL